MHNDSFFNLNMHAKQLDENGRRYMLEIDKAVILDEETDTVKTPYGVTSMRCLSPGVKTLLNLLYIISNNLDIAVSINECGANVIKEIFNIVESNGGARLLLRHINFGDYVCYKEFLLNDRHVLSNSFELCAKIPIEIKKWG